LGGTSSRGPSGPLPLPGGGHGTFHGFQRINAAVPLGPQAGIIFRGTGLPSRDDAGWGTGKPVSRFSRPALDVENLSCAPFSAWLGSFDILGFFLSPSVPLTIRRGVVLRESQTRSKVGGRAFLLRPYSNLTMVPKGGQYYCCRRLYWAPAGAFFPVGSARGAPPWFSGFRLRPVGALKRAVADPMGLHFVLGPQAFPHTEQHDSRCCSLRKPSSFSRGGHFASCYVGFSSGTGNLSLSARPPPGMGFATNPRALPPPWCEMYKSVRGPPPGVFSFRLGLLVPPAARFVQSVETKRLGEEGRNRGGGFSRGDFG